MKQKQSRWYQYETTDGIKSLCVYDNPYTKLACSVSVTKPEDITYYRNTFNLAKVCGEEPPCFTSS